MAVHRRELTERKMSDFVLPPAPLDHKWLELRERLASTAREMHSFAVTGNPVNGATILVMAAYFAELAMSIPLTPVPVTPFGLVHPITPVASQALQHEPWDEP
jgi:hypothetical protein